MSKNGGKPVGWEELLQVMNSANGWADYGISGDRTGGRDHLQHRVHGRTEAGVGV